MSLDPEALLRQHLPLIERIIERVRRDGGLPDADAEDFHSSVKLALIDHDYAILRAWKGRSSLPSYLTVVIRRILSSQRNRQLGRWEPSAAAREMGEAAVALETLVLRDGRPVEQALPLVRAIDATLTEKDAAAMLARLPPRAPRARMVPLDDVDAESVGAPGGADTPMAEERVSRLSDAVSRAVREALAARSAEDRAIVRMHFANAMTIADIARALRLPQRPLYRRIEALAAHLRRALAAAGIDRGAARELIGSAVQSLDFGLCDGKSSEAPQSPSVGESEAEG
jgi:RNA polymerase sigma factor (sigma-70 family)